jgi:Uma2 family endonuclease
MTVATSEPKTQPLLLDVSNTTFHITPEQFDKLCLDNPMLEYQRLGVQLGLLVNPQDKQVEIYRVGQSVEILESPASVSYEEFLPGFVLNLNKIW